MFDRTDLLRYHVIQDRLWGTDTTSLPKQKLATLSNFNPITKLNQLSLVLVKFTHSPSSLNAGAFPIWVSSMLVWSVAGLALLLVSVSGSSSGSGIISTLGDCCFVSAFAVVSGGTLGGASFSWILRSGTECGPCASPLFSNSLVVLITAFA